MGRPKSVATTTSKMSLPEDVDLRKPLIPRLKVIIRRANAKTRPWKVDYRERNKQQLASYRAITRQRPSERCADAKCGWGQGKKCMEEEPTAP
ncbi:unnamed protein product [Toxocara canis]|uniref:Uncharacterized protein n=1 Tax=Toxocara canis TaxID=6265 RepID=A0A183TVP6_TOXCA|nr:unnamed protein product [Toxocara canis]